MECSYKYATLLTKIVFVLVLVALLLHMIGFYTTYWAVFDYIDPFRKTELLQVREYEGMWKYCVQTRYMMKCHNFKSHGSWFEATQAFETLGFIAAIVALVLIVLYVFVPQTSGKKIVFILAMLACFAAAGCIILGIIIYGSKMDNLSWSFALCCIAGIIFGISGILLVVDMLKR
ncbi:uncharacterized protein LOC132716451 isoform X2 [Ruditapes philippinarum]|uniref:uncharacterized protein LOC132716451 isoform X2 n=1 Tax=Ruditapes philippinarum TaxID=129788 RepID=UPI00295AD0AE|nr:uncharacterized protein LOC132716451 isoform X2 [Ruditapes philippinarum]